jgi:uncharacterized protein (TIGR03905 family)
MAYIYKTKGTCSSKIEVELDGNIIKSVHFTGGCNGNLNGISKIVEGMTVENVVSKFTGLTCGYKKTSCPDQLAQAVQEAYKAIENN